MSGKDEYNSSLRTLVQIEPSDTLVFKILSTLTAQATFTITNVTSDSYLAFKVKTTCPARYLVRPNQGIIGPSGKATIAIIMQEKDCNDLLQLTMLERQTMSDKFLIQSAVVETSFCEGLAGKIAKDVAEELNKLWNTLHKSQLHKKKLRCCFITENDPENVSQQRNSTGGVLLSEPTAIKDTWRPERYDSYKPTKTGTQRNDGETEDDQDTKQELNALRAKYDELVSYTVQVSAQRDRLTQDLDQLQKASSDPSSDGLRNRRTNANGKAAPGSSRTGTTTTEQKRPQGGNNIIVYLLIALIAYVIGRYF